LVAVPGAAARPDRPAAHSAVLAGLHRAAREHGDIEAAAAARDALEQLYPATFTGGVLSHDRAAAELTVRLAADGLLFRGAWRATICLPPRRSAHAGPLLDTDAYPAVLVAKAASSGADLELVLYPGAGSGVRDLPLSRLRPGRRYTVTAPDGSREIVAGADGSAVVAVHLDGRTPVAVRPV
jgi:hypothetical protein